MDAMHVPTGYKLTDLGVIPEEWEVKTLGELGECIIGLTYSPSDINDSGTLVLRSSNIQDGNLDLDDQVRVKKVIPERLIVREGDLLVCVRNGSRRLIGKNILLDSRVVGETFGAFMSIYRSPLNNYIAQAFSSGIVAKQIDENLGATINQITNRDLNAFKIPLPPLAEQQAIATALGEMDALLAAQCARLEKHRALKQGLLQGLLSGQQRLPGFAREWEMKKFGDIVPIKKGRLITERTCVPGSIPVIAGGQTPAYFHNSANRHGPTITVSASGAYAGYVAYHKGPIFASDCSTIEEGKGYDLGFIYSYLSSNQQKIYKAQTGGAQPHIHAKDLAPFEINLPPIEEQRAIAAVLSEADAALEALEAEHAKTQLLKQGLMQNLLTGKIRLV